MNVHLPQPRRGVLDPVERLSEILFGLIMVLSFTGSLSVAEAGREDVRAMLVGALGCNLAWGIIDAVMYLMTVLIERGRMLTVARAVRASHGPEHGHRLIVDALPDSMSELFDGAALESARQRISASPASAQRPRLVARDWVGSAGVFLLVFLSTFPVVLPFLFIPHLHRAMRVSNGVAIVMLYVTGHMMGRYAGLRPVWTGLVMMAIGIVLVGITIALGG